VCVPRRACGQMDNLLACGGVMLKQLMYVAGCRLGGQTIDDAFLLDKSLRSKEQNEIVLACGTCGQEVQDAFNTSEGQRDRRQRQIVLVIMQNGKATATAWEKHHTGQVICVPPPPHQCVRGTH